MAEIQRALAAAEEETEGLSAFWQYRGAILIGADFAIVVASFLVAYYLRFHLQFLAIKYVAIQAVGSYLKGALLLATVWVFLIWRDGGYETGLRGIASPIVRIRSVLMAGLKALAVLMVVSYMYRGLLLSRQVYLMTGVFSLSGMILLRLLFRELDRDLAAQGIGLQRILLIGLDSLAEEFAERLARVKGTVQVVGSVIADGESNVTSFAGYPVLGTLEEIEQIYARQPFDKLVLSSSVLSPVVTNEQRTRLMDLLNFCERHCVSLYTIPNVLDVAVSHNEVGTFSGVPLVELRDASLHKGYAAVKRIMDLCVAGTVLLLGAPVWGLLAIAIKCAGKGPALFTQVRAGLHGRPFRMYKFRSMVADAERRLDELVDTRKLDEPVFKLRNDPRVTPIGRFIRRTGLDEIPQLVNVLKGEMSVVGPRPEELALVARYNPWQRRRLKAKPGITGYQQINNRGEPSLAARVKYDLVYLKHQSFLLDLYIMLKTVVVVLRGSGVTH